MRRSCLFVSVMLLLPLLGPARADKISKETINSQGRQRTFYLFVPGSIKPPAPLLITLHGSGRNGLSLVEKWKNLAAKEGLILAGPDALDSQVWNTPEDGPDFLRDLAEELKAKYPVDPRRVYLFGHSAGAVFALGISMFESRYFAAAAVHAGAWRDPQEFALTQFARRKIPLAIVVGDSDAFFPVAAVKATKGHNHNYYDSAGQINQVLWNFMKKCALAGEPAYEQYQFQGKR